MCATVTGRSECSLPPDGFTDVSVEVGPRFMEALNTFRMYYCRRLRPVYSRLLYADDVVDAFSLYWRVCELGGGGEVRVIRVFNVVCFSLAASSYYQSWEGTNYGGRQSIIVFPSVLWQLDDGGWRAVLFSLVHTPKNQGWPQIVSQ